LLASCHSAVVKVPLQLKAGPGNKNAVCMVTSGGGISTLKTLLLSALPKRPPFLTVSFLEPAAVCTALCSIQRVHILPPLSGGVKGILEISLKLAPNRAETRRKPRDFPLIPFP
jgi:hypothetical protein